MTETKYKTFWRRFWAGWIDALVLSALLFIHELIMSRTLPLTLFVLWNVLYSFSYVMYDVIFLGMYGQTIGKRFMKLIVLDINENKISFKHAILRDIVPIIAAAIGLISDFPLLMKGIDPTKHYTKGNMPWHYWAMFVGMLGWFVIELVSMLTNNKRRALHDFIAGTVVVRKNI